MDMSISGIGLDEFADRMLVGKAIRCYKITQYCNIFPGVSDQADNVTRAAVCPYLQNVKL